MGRIPDAIADALAAEVESRTEWDEAPALYTFYVESGRCRLSQIPLPEMVWAMDERARARQLRQRRA